MYNDTATTIDKYCLVRKIGSGYRFSSVYLAHEADNKEAQVAITFFDPDFGMVNGSTLYKILLREVEEHQKIKLSLYCAVVNIVERAMSVKEDCFSGVQEMIDCVGVL